MGANAFVETVKRERGLDLQRAFSERAERSRIEDGRSYSGEIGMKWEVRRALRAKPCTTLKDARDEAQRLLRAGDYSDRDDPCWAIEVAGDEGGWVFFGVARS